MADAERFLAEQRAVEFGDPGAWVQLAAIDRAEDALIGDCAVRLLAEQPRTAEVGITLAPARQGTGMASEARLVEADWFKGGWTTLRVYAVLRREWEAQRLPGGERT